MVLAGWSDIEQLAQGARFVAVCDAFRNPIPTLVACRLPARYRARKRWCDQTRRKLLSLMVNNGADGGSYHPQSMACYDVMASKHLRSDFNYAWAHSEIAVMGAKGATEIIHRADLNDPKTIAATNSRLRGAFAEPVCCRQERGFIDEVTSPAMTRKRICPRLCLAAQQRKPRALEEAQHHPA